jgi:hypothetical protein
MNKIISAALLTLVMGGVHAQAAYEGQAYVGATLGWGQTRLDCTGTASCDDSGVGAKAYVGYKVTPDVAVEFNYLNFGKAEASVVAGSSLVKVDVRSRAFVLAGVYHWDFTPEMGGAVHVGVASVRTKATVQGQTLAKDEAKPYLGLSLDYAFTKHLKAVAALDLSEAELSEGVKGRVSLLSAGAQYEF